MDRCPYKGLLPYTEDDAPYFFGRDTERRVIGENLRASRLTLLYGESGAGKSSVLRAGVAYDLRNDPDYAIVVFPRIQKGEAVDSWRNDPVAGITRAIHESLGGLLKRSLKPQFAPPPPEPKPVIMGNTMILPPEPPRKPTLLHDLLQAAAGGKEAADKPPDLGGLLEEYADATGRNLLIVLDQFEEYFQYHPSEAGAGTLAGELPRLVNRRDFPVNFLISIRQDAVASLDRFKNYIPNLFSNYLRIEYLSPAAAQSAMLKPLGKYNEEVEIGQRALAAIRGHLRAGEPMNPNWTLHVIFSIPEGSADSEAVKQARARFGDLLPLSDIPQVPLVITEAVAADVVQEIIRAQGDDRQQVQAAYLQLVMRRWWQKEVNAHSGEMRRETLDELGGVKKIVDEHLEKTIQGIGAWRQDDVAKIFAPMVTSAGRKIAQTVSELIGSTDLTQYTVEEVLEALFKARILATVPPPRGSPPQEKCYEFAHDVVAKAALEWLGRRKQAQKAEAAEHEAAQAKLRAEEERKHAEEQTRQIIKLRRLA
ncbi:MAG TPA: ATP-binding protein [Terracidiphilus sp.]|nr:ATP-binding protein [Terracidiphilus sp.]